MLINLLDYQRRNTTLLNCNAGRKEKRFVSLSTIYRNIIVYQYSLQRNLKMMLLV